MFSNKIALVTGGNFGIGRGIALKFASEGASLAIVARNRQRAEAVVEELTAQGATAAFFPADVSQEDAVINMIEAVVERFGGIDTLVNNAGVGSQHCGNVESTPPGKRWEVLRGSTLDSTYFVTAHALPHLAKSRESAVVNISSTATYAPGVNRVGGALVPDRYPGSSRAEGSTGTGACTGQPRWASRA